MNCKSNIDVFAIKSSKTANALLATVKKCHPSVRLYFTTECAKCEIVQQNVQSAIFYLQSECEECNIVSTAHCAGHRSIPGMTLWLSQWNGWCVASIGAGFVAGQCEREVHLSWGCILAGCSWTLVQWGHFQVQLCCTVKVSGIRGVIGSVYLIE